MSATGFNGNELEQLVDRHIELCELFEGMGASARRQAPALITQSGGKATAECLADLVDQALAAYEGSDFAQDPRILALKIALTEAIIERS
jgi:hypothetical protein